MSSNDSSAILKNNEQTTQKTTLKSVLENNPTFKHVIAGGCGGAMGVLFTQPLDVLKTRMQAKKDFKSVTIGRQSLPFTHIYNALKYTYTREGMQGLFRGLLPNLLGVIPSRAIYFGTYDRSRKFYTSIFGESSDTSTMLAAATATIIVTTIMNPVFFLKTRVQLEEAKASQTRTTYYGCFKQVLREEGITRFWSGLTASWLGILEGALFFVLYERAKEAEMFRETTDRKNPNFNPIVFLSLSAGCKLVASALTYPHEVVRTRLRERGHGSGLFKTFGNIAREEGWRGLYSGMGAHLTRVIPNTAIMFCVVEFVLNRITQFEEEEYFDEE